MKILTFNWHEAYICSLAKTAHDFEIVERLKGGSKIWFYNTRPVPENARIIKEKDAFDRLSSGYYDAVVCHNLKDLTEVKDYPVPKILIFHNKLTTELALGGNKYSKEGYLKSVRELISGIDNLHPVRKMDLRRSIFPHEQISNGVHLVFISKTKMDDWGLVGDVITPGIDLSDYGGYHGSEKKVLRVGNFMKRRDIMLGYSIQQKILNSELHNSQSSIFNLQSSIPNTLLGLNEPSDGGRFTESWDDLKECYRSHRVYLNTTVDGFEDGYNLSSLEAMATGMPVATIANSTSPIIDGYNGYISNDTEYLSERIKHLFESPEDAKKLGENARKTVERDFNIKDFVEKWNGVFEKLKAQSSKLKAQSSKTVAGQAVKSEIRNPKSEIRNILLSYVSYPVTTARYIEKSLRKFHNVVTCGPSIGEDIIRLWNLENMKEEVKPQDISCESSVSAGDILKRLPQGWKPCLFLWIESVYGYFPEGIRELPFPTACCLIDSHINLSWHIQWARQFDFVFVAQRKYIPEFEKAGCKNVFWLPLGCDPDIHKKFEVEKVYDIGFVGSITKNHVRRKLLLDKLANRFNVHIERSFLEDMAITFSRSKIIFNEAIKDDLNMRVFEALSAGSMLLTDEAAGSGLTDFFKDREHLVIYNDNNIVELADYYLKHDDEREAIAQKGKEEVLKRHTYDHRVGQMMGNIFGKMQEIRSKKQEARENLASCLLPLASEIEDPLLLQALRQMEEKKYEGALKNLTFALKGRELSSIERFTLYTSLGECSVKLGKLDDSVGFYKMAKEITSLHGGLEKPYIGIGTAYMQDGRYNKAVCEFEASVKLNPQSDKAFCGLGISLFQSGRFTEGYEMLKTALDINIENMMALEMHLKYSYMLNRLDVALQYVLKYLELHPANLDMLYALSGIYFKTGRREDAVDALERILLFEPEHRNALEMMEKCQSKSEELRVKNEIIIFNS
ncbi:MAG: glycosyltransferase [Nitrospinae bacterium]|nr:glycosyltransferase [Nitrospinota bacterium]